MIKTLSAQNKVKTSTGRHLVVVTIFIIAASMLVVLTTFAINMLTATGDLNRLLISWSDSNSKTAQSAISYIKSRNENDLLNYEHQVSNRKNVEYVINGLLSDTPEPNLIIREFNPEDIHPNEITGLIRIFTLFHNSPEVVEMKQTWAAIQFLVSQKQEFIDSLVNSPSELSDAELEKLHSFDSHIYDEIRHMITNNSGILLLLKRYSLWFTVLLGILIVLVGVIYTVRGLKNINKMQKVLAERDYLAMFPELNQFPVLNISTQGSVDFMNQAAKELFPNLKDSGLKHPFLTSISQHFNEIISQYENSRLTEVEVNGKYFQQAVHFLSETKGVHIHSIDITELKKKQIEVTHNLKEKEALLAEVHHRVKNNMAVITGLLELQEMMGEDPDTALAESRSRIKSMAIIHELLYQSNTFSEIETSQYLNKLGEHLRLSLSHLESVQVPNEVQEEITLNINQAIPLALLLNEIAFYLCQEATKVEQYLNLNLRIKNKNDQMCLEITSSQPGLKNPLSKSEKPTLRMSLIKNLLTQIEGDLYMPITDTLYIEIIFSTNITKGSSSTLN